VTSQLYKTVESRGKAHAERGGNISLIARHFPSLPLLRSINASLQPI